MVKFLTVSFVASIFLAAVAFCLQDGWVFVACRWGAMISLVTFVTTFFSGMLPERIVELESSESERQNILTARSRNFTQWQIKYDHLPKG